MEQNTKGKIDWLITLLPLSIILFLCVLFFVMPEQSNLFLGKIRYFFGDVFGVYYLIIGLGIFVLSLYLAAKKFLRQVGYANNIDAPVKQVKVVSKAGIYYRDASLETKEDVRYYPWSDSFTDEFYVTDSRDKDFTHGKLSKDLGEYGQYGEDIIINEKVNNNRTFLVLGDSCSGC